MHRVYGFCLLDGGYCSPAVCEGPCLIKYYYFHIYSPFFFRPGNFPIWFFFDSRVFGILKCPDFCNCVRLRLTYTHTHTPCTHTHTPCIYMDTRTHMHVLSYTHAHMHTHTCTHAVCIPLPLRYSKSDLCRASIVFYFCIVFMAFASPV